MIPRLIIILLMSAAGAALAEITIKPAPGRPLVLPGLANTNLPSLDYTNRPANPPLDLTVPNLTAPSAPLKAPKWLLREQSPPPGPGAYVTKPFSCIVIVPGPQADDCIIPGATSSGFMPNAMPKLRFEPLSAAGKSSVPPK